MKHHVRTFTETVEYDEFEPGEVVELAGSPSYGRHIVTEFHHPTHAGDEPTVFLEGFAEGKDARQFNLAADQTKEKP